MYPVIWAIYRHYKSIWWSDHTYQVIGIAKHSETNQELVIYKPLYDASATRLQHAQFAARPVDMRFDTIVWQWKQMQRFTLEQ